MHHVALTQYGVISSVMGLPNRGGAWASGSGLNILRTVRSSAGELRSTPSTILEAFDAPVVPSERQDPCGYPLHIEEIVIWNKCMSFCSAARGRRINICLGVDENLRDLSMATLQGVT